MTRIVQATVTDSELLAAIELLTAPLIALDLVARRGNTFYVTLEGDILVCQIVSIPVMKAAYEANLLEADEFSAQVTLMAAVIESAAFSIGIYPKLHLN